MTHRARDDDFVGADEVGMTQADSHGCFWGHPAVEGIHADAFAVRDVDDLHRATHHKVMIGIAPVLPFAFLDITFKISFLTMHSIAC